MGQRETFGWAGPLRIAHVITRLINGGADENTVMSCNYAVEAGHDVTLIHGAHTHPEIMTKIDTRVKVNSLSSLVRPISPLSDGNALRELTRLFRTLKPDVVHTHTSKAGVLGRLAACAARTPVVVHGVHIVPFANIEPLQRIAYLTVERAIQSMTHAFIDVSAGMRDIYVAAGIGTPDRHYVVHSGFDLRRFRKASLPEDWRCLLRLDEGEARPPVLLMIAAFEARKRHLEFLNVLPKVTAQFPEIRLLLAGDGPLKEDIKARIAALGLECNVILTGFRSDPERLIALADLCLLTSKREGLPRVLMQYLAGGKPCVVTDLPGLDEVVRHNVNGIIIPSDNMEAIADSVIMLLEDGELRARLTHGAVTADLSDWDADRMGEQIDAVYHDVISKRRAKSSEFIRAAVSS